MDRGYNISSYILVTTVGLLIHFIIKGLKAPLGHLPGPFLSRFTRLPLGFATVSGKQLFYIHDLHNKYGPVVRISPYEVAVSSWVDAREIHRAGSGFLKTEWYEDLVRGQGGVFSLRDPKMHAQRRKLLSRPFSKSVIRNTWEPVVREKARLAVSQIQNELATAGVSDVLKWSTFLATDVISLLMFGASFNMLKKGEKNEYIRTLETILKGSGIMSEIPVLKTIIPLIPFQSVRKIFGNDNTIAQHSKQLLTDGKEDPGSHRNIFYGMINESEKDETSLTEIEVAYEAKNLIVAGSDTTAVTLTYLIWVVLSRPELHSKIKAELSTLGEDWAESQLEELPLLNATITETLRLYGAAPGGLPRTVPKEGATFSGYHIPGGMVVSTQCWTSHQDPALFPDPEKFDPSRWLPGQNEASEEARSAMSPFGSGSRICLGIHLAWMELRLATTEFFLGCGDVKLAPSVTEESMKPQHFFLIAPIAHKCEIMRASR